MKEVPDSPVTGALRTLSNSPGGCRRGISTLSTGSAASILLALLWERRLSVRLARHRKCHRLVPPSPNSKLNVSTLPVKIVVSRRLLKRMVQGRDAEITERAVEGILVDAGANPAANPAASITGAHIVPALLVITKQSRTVLLKHPLSLPYKY